MKIYFEDGVTHPNVQILADSDPAPSGYTEDTTIANFFAYGTQYGLTNAQTVKEIINLITDWATFPAADKTALQELANWFPTAITLGDGVANGATLALSSGAGMYINFAANSNDEFIANISLERNGMYYDGSEFDVELYWMKFGATSGNVKWELDYAFVEIGDNAYTKSSGMLTLDIAVGGIANQTMVANAFAKISGAAGAKTLQLTLRRKGTGAGGDSYSGDAELYGFNLEK